jgi:hypothetical protein
MSEPILAGSTAPPRQAPTRPPSGRRFAKLVSLWDHHPLKVHIATLFTVLIVIACGVIAWSNHVQGRKVVLGAALDVIERIDNDAASEMKHLFKPAEMLVTWMSRAPISEGGAFEKRVGSLPALVEVLRNQPQIGAIYAGYDNGEFLLVRALRDPVARAAFAAPDSAAFVYQTIERRGSVMQSRLVVLDAALDKLSDSVLPDWKFDPRTRPWFVEATKTDAVVTTAPYVFFSTRQVGVTVARRAEHGRAVVGADVTLSDVSEKLKQVRPTPSSQLAMYGIAGDRVIAF